MADNGAPPCSLPNELGLAECARLFALLNMGLANNYIVNWDAKYTYNLAVPVTAIRNGDMDGNDATERDAGWTPLNVTPLHPEYPSQATINATVASTILVFGAATNSLHGHRYRGRERTRMGGVADMVEEQKECPHLGRCPAAGAPSSLRHRHGRKTH